ncbi:MAG: hypothetical protein U1E17_21055 [Geminicoccaceae bacterium]
MSVPEKPLRTRAGAAEYLRNRWGIIRSVATLAKLACLGGGPEFMKAGRTPLYAEESLDHWASALLRPAKGGRAA